MLADRANWTTVHMEGAKVILISVVLFVHRDSLDDDV